MVLKAKVYVFLNKITQLIFFFDGNSYFLLYNNFSISYKYNCYKLNNSILEKLF